MVFYLEYDALLTRPERNSMTAPIVTTGIDLGSLSWKLEEFK
jgi:hypothetical protein